MLIYLSGLFFWHIPYYSPNESLEKKYNAYVKLPLYVLAEIMSLCLRSHGKWSLDKSTLHH